MSLHRIKDAAPPVPPKGVIISPSPWIPGQPSIVRYFDPIKNKRTYPRLPMVEEINHMIWLLTLKTSQIGAHALVGFEASFNLVEKEYRVHMIGTPAVFRKP